MSYNNGLERKRFFERQKLMREELTAQGVSDEVIEGIFEFDLGLLNSDRRYATHTQPLLPIDFNEDEDCCEKNPLYRKFAAAVCCLDDCSAEHERYWWVEDVENYKLAGALKLLTRDDLELLTLIIMEGFTQAEVAAMIGVSQMTISKRLKKIKDFIRKRF